MRPVRLVVAGFGAFREETEVDFDDADFFALVGPTGAGKSTVIDAMCFALYGNIPRYDDERLRAAVVSLGALEAKVSFTFDLEGERYVATRVMRLDGKGGTRPSRASLERTGADGTTSALTEKVSEMDKLVLDLIGLDFADFTKCVVLPQGDFAQFLRAKGKERNELLSRLLRLDVYERVGKRAREEATEKKLDAQARGKRLEDLAHATSEAKAAAEARVRTLADLEEALEGGRPLDEELVARIHVATEAATGAAAHAEKLSKITVPDAARALMTQMKATAEALAAAEKTASEAAARRDAADRRLAGLPDIDPLVAAREAHAYLARVRAELDAGRAAVAAATTAEKIAATTRLEAEEAHAQATAALEAARTANAAAAVAQALEVGQPCPVCLQPVSSLPEHASADIRAAERAVKESAEKMRVADEEHRRQREQLATAVGRLEQHAAHERELLAKVEGQPDAAALEARIREIGEAQAGASQARGDETAARKAHQELVAVRDALQERAVKAQAVLQTQRDSVASLEPPPLDTTDLLASWGKLATWAEGELERQRRAADEANAQVAALEKERAENLTALRNMCVKAAVEVPVDADLHVLAMTTARARSAADQDVNLLDKEIAEAAVLAKEVARLTEAAAVAEELGRLLKANNFIEWLIAEALDIVVADGSRTLRELSGGQFSLTVGPQGEFFVIDHRNADERRSVRTLSGGETFQASLALALALSDQVRHLASEGAPRLDAIFLDEGFGTLDPESLEVVASTIENLGRDGRVVGIITHVRELADRVPVRFEVTKSHRGSTVEKKVL